MKAEERTQAVRVVRLSQTDAGAVRLINEYYEAIDVTQRDDPAVLERVISNSAAGVWLAYLNNVAVACVVLKPLPGIDSAAECKRLYVQPHARGRGLANLLLDALEAFAEQAGLAWIYLDSFEGLKAAVALYTKRGYVPCARYNDNPQANIFFRKHLAKREVAAQDSRKPPS